MLWIKNNSLASISSKSYDFGVVRIKHPIASGGQQPPRPPASEMYLVYLDSLFQDPCYLATKTVCIYKMCVPWDQEYMYSWFDQ